MNISQIKKKGKIVTPVNPVIPFQSQYFIQILLDKTFQTLEHNFVNQIYQNACNYCQQMQSKIFQCMESYNQPNSDYISPEMEPKSLICDIMMSSSLKIQKSPKQKISKIVKQQQIDQMNNQNMEKRNKYQRKNQNVFIALKNTQSNEQDHIIRSLRDRLLAANAYHQLIKKEKKYFIPPVKDLSKRTFDYSGKLMLQKPARSNSLTEQILQYKINKAQKLNPINQKLQLKTDNTPIQILIETKIKKSLQDDTINNQKIQQREILVDSLQSMQLAEGVKIKTQNIEEVENKQLDISESRRKLKQNKLTRGQYLQLKSLEAELIQSEEIIYKQYKQSSQKTDNTRISTTIPSILESRIIPRRNHKSIQIFNSKILVQNRQLNDKYLLSQDPENKISQSIQFKNKKQKVPEKEQADDQLKFIKKQFSAKNISSARPLILPNIKHRHSNNSLINIRQKVKLYEKKPYDTERK